MLAAEYLIDLTSSLCQSSIYELAFICSAIMLGMSLPSSFLPIMAKEIAWNWIDQSQNRIIEVADTIWGYAELGLTERKSSSLLQDELKKHGFKVEAGVAGMPTAFIASWGSGKPIIGVMGEFDALPGISNKNIDMNATIITRETSSLATISSL
jgi:hypothetical protein